LRTTLPVPVKRKRFAALRLVLSFDDIRGTHSAQRARRNSFGRTRASAL
jgi:hypothetical protein